MTYYWSVTETDRQTNGETGGESRRSALMNVCGRATVVGRVGQLRRVVSSKQRVGICFSFSFTCFVRVFF